MRVLFIKLLNFKSLVKLSLFLGSLVMSLVIFEMGLRISAKEDFSLDKCVSLDKNFHHVMIASRDCRYKTSEWDVNYKINSMGLRNEEVTPKKNGVFRILILGDSFVQGHGVSGEDSFVRRVEDRLNLGGQKVEIINGGVFGYSPLVEYLFLARKGIFMEPDLVLAGVNFTDFYEDRKRFLELKLSYPEASDEAILQKVEEGEAIFDFAKINAIGSYREAQSEVLPPVSDELKAWLRLHFKSYGFLADLVKKRNQPVQQDVLHQGDIDRDFVAIMRNGVVSEKDYQELWRIPMFALETMDNFLKSKNTPLAIFGIPSAVQISDDEWLGRKGLALPGHFVDSRPYGVEFGLRLGKLGVDFVDLADDFRKSNDFPLYFAQDGHFTEAGHGVAAEVLFRYLGNYLKSKSEF